MEEEFNKTEEIKNGATGGQTVPEEVKNKLRRFLALRKKPVTRENASPEKIREAADLARKFRPNTPAAESFNKN